MAIQVRCDFTPGEFDIVRHALRELITSFDLDLEDETEFSETWKLLNVQKTRASDLAEKLRS